MSTLRTTQIIIEIHGIVISLLLLAGMYFEKYKKDSPSYSLMNVITVNMIVLLFDILCVIFDGNPDPVRNRMNVFSNYMLYGIQYILLSFLAVYIYRMMHCHMYAPSRKWLLLEYGICAIGLGCLVVNRFTGAVFYFDSRNNYCRGPLFMTAMEIGIVSMVLVLCAILQSRSSIPNHAWKMLLLNILVPFAGLLLQTVVSGFSFMNIGTTITVIAMTVDFEIHNIRNREKEKKFLLQSRAYLQNSQMQPHFIFNSLNTIHALIDDDPREAKRAVHQFSKYLRMGMNYNHTESLISIWEEMDYVKHYVYMEMLRFGDKLKVSFLVDKKADFQIPFLTVQPLVENAIRHGLCKKVEGGTVIIRVRSNEKWNTIQVIDDGVGTDLELLKKTNLKKSVYNEDSEGIGLVNVEERIRLMCGGRMKLVSSPGKGMSVTISIPKGGTIKRNS